MPQGQFAARRGLRNASFSVKLGVMVATLSVAVIGTLATTLLALSLSSGVRAFVGGEGLWSKAQKDAVYALARYLQTQDPGDYAGFRQALAVPLGDRAARLELSRPDYDRAAVESGFLAGGNAVEDIPSMIFVFRHLGDVDFVAEAIRIWSQADRSLQQLEALGEEILQAAAKGALDPAAQKAYLQRVDQINAALTPLENRFSEILGEGARRTQRQLLIATALISTLLLGGGLAVAWIVGRDLRRSIGALRDGALRVAAGDLEHRLTPHGGGELTQLMQAFNEMAASRQAVELQLRDASQLHARIMENSTNAIYTMDREGRFVTANRRTCEITGYPLEQLIGLPWAQIVDPAYLDDLYPRYLATISGQSPILNYEVPLTRPDGRVVEITFSIAALWHAGEIVGVVGAAEDVTERKRADTELRRSNRELEHFAFVVSHDLQEPLTTVSGFAKLLAQRHRETLGDEARQWIDYITRGCSGMQSLIEDLLAYAQVSRSTAGLVPTDLGDSVRRAIEQVRATLDAASAVVEVGPLPTLPAYPQQMVQLFQNLIGNAAKFRSAAPPRIEIQARALDTGGWRLSVRDNGIGIPESARQDVFGLFHRLHRRDRHSGNGIGLTLCKRIVELHGGEIWIEDAQPGTEVVVVLGLPTASTSPPEAQPLR